jgi:hypothetical protein
VDELLVGEELVEAPDRHRRQTPDWNSQISQCTESSAERQEQQEKQRMAHRVKQDPSQTAGMLNVFYTKTEPLLGCAETATGRRAGVGGKRQAQHQS